MNATFHVTAAQARSRGFTHYGRICGVPVYMTDPEQTEFDFMFATLFGVFRFGLGVVAYASAEAVGLPVAHKKLIVDNEL